jgi:DNA-binding transcriptional regulator YiaG
MTPPELRACLDATGLSARWLAAATGRSPNSGSNWERGRVAVPADVAEWLRRAVAWHEANRPPRRVT